MRDRVTTQYLELALPAEGFQLANGEKLPAIRVAYESYGALAEDKSNVIYVCHALTGSAHAAGYHSDDPKSRGWWEPHPDSSQPEMIGPGAAIDTDRYFVVCANILGGCAGTTGPTTIDPTTGELYGINFPLVTIQDAVAVQRLFLEQLGISRLYAVIGGSMGGMQALEWAIKHPDFVERCICIATADSLSPQALAFDIIARQEIESDPDWKQGQYPGEHPPRAGLSRARQLGHVTYLSDQSMHAKFGRDEHDRPRPADSSPFSTSFEVESYLNYNGNAFVDRFDANSYLYISRMMDMFDLAKRHGSVRQALAKTKAKFLIVSIDSDWLFPPAQQLELVQHLIAMRREVSYLNMASHCGHDAFLIEYGLLCPAVNAFLDGEPPKHPESIIREDVEYIKSMLSRSQHLLDLGAGEGDLMLALQRETNSTGLCLELDYDKVIVCMSKGLNAIQLNADTGLQQIADDAFDCVLANQTIQQLHSALGAMKQMLRIAKSAIVSFPNFANYRYRFALMLFGRLPVSDDLPFNWYDTPNIHLVTIADFLDLCESNRIQVDGLACAAIDALGRTLLTCGLRNAGAARGIAHVSRQTK